MTVNEGGTVSSTADARPWLRRPWVWVAAAVVVVLAVVIGVVVALRPGRVAPAGRTVAGVAVGGLDERKLRVAVDSSVRRRVEQFVTVTVGADRFRLSPVAAGLRLDVGATVRDALARGAGAVPAEVTADAAELGRLLVSHQRAARDTVVRLAAPRPVLDAKGDASFSASGRGVDRTEGTAGWTLDAAAGSAAVLEAVRNGRAEVTVTTRPVAPRTTPAAYAAVDQLIGTFTTYHSCCQARVTNIHLIAKLVDATVIAPGDTFSLNGRVGERTAAKGFVAAPAIVDGELDDQLGGGISQFSTTLFNATWFAGLTILKHQPHSKYISRYPPGREATLDWGAIDQVIRNDTAAPVVIRTRTTATSVTVALYGHTGDRKVVSTTGARVPSGEEGGFGVTVRRAVYQGAAKTGGSAVHWTYDGLD
jgi:vancomycin resistance protein YoaR